MSADTQNQLTVSLLIFSGIRNPRWSLTDAHQARLATLVTQLPEVGAQFELPERWSWYKGFMVQGADRSRIRILPLIDVDDTPAPDAVVVDAFNKVRVDRGRLLEEWLFNTAPDTLLKDLAPRGSERLTFKYLKRVLKASLNISGIGGSKFVGGLACSQAPVFPAPPGAWKTYEEENNCYNYANNELAQNGFSACPGGTELASFTPATLRTAAVNDGLIHLGDSLPAVCPIPLDSHIVAICSRKELGIYRDFHCLRLDAAGAWSHKDNGGGVRMADDGKNAILDLRASKWKIAMKLAGFFISDKATRNIRAPEDP